MVGLRMKEALATRCGGGESTLETGSAAALSEEQANRQLGHDVEVQVEGGERRIGYAGA
jgi:hypothetical protein